MFSDAQTRAGPVLLPGETADAIVLALRELNGRVDIADRGGYLRISAPGRCVLTAESVAHWLGRPFRVPQDLERIMPSFQGRMEIEGGTVCWLAAGAAPVPEEAV